MSDNGTKSRRRVLSVIVHDEPGVLVRVAGLFAGRGYNIDGLTVSRITSSEFANIEGGVARITITTVSSDEHVEQIITQIRGKVVPVLDVSDITDHPDKVEADITLVKVLTDDVNKQTLISTMASTQFRAMAIRTKPSFVTLRFVGQESAAQEFVQAIMRFGVEVETAHSGPVAIA